MRKAFVAVLAMGLVASAFMGGAFAAATITSQDIVNQTIRKVDIGADAVGDSELRAGSVGKSELEPGSVGYSELTNNVKSDVAWQVTPAGRTIHGAVGGDFDAHAALLDWGVVVSLPSEASSPLGDDDVYVDVTGWESGDEGQVQPSTSDSLPGCSGTVDEPTAPAGTVCIYVAGGDNATDLNGYSVRPGTDESPYGFKLSWTNSGAGDTFIDAVWAYTAD